MLGFTAAPGNSRGFLPHRRRRRRRRRLSSPLQHRPVLLLHDTSLLFRLPFPPLPSPPLVFSPRVGLAHAHKGRTRDTRKQRVRARTHGEETRYTRPRIFAYAKERIRCAPRLRMPRVRTGSKSDIVCEHRACSTLALCACVTRRQEFPRGSIVIAGALSRLKTSLQEQREGPLLQLSPCPLSAAPCSTLLPLFPFFIPSLLPVPPPSLVHLSPPPPPPKRFCTVSLHLLLLPSHPPPRPPPLPRAVRPSSSPFRSKNLIFPRRTYTYIDAGGRRPPFGICLISVETPQRASRSTGSSFPLLPRLNTRISREWTRDSLSIRQVNFFSHGFPPEEERRGRGGRGKEGFYIPVPYSRGDICPRWPISGQLNSLLQRDKLSRRSLFLCRGVVLIKRAWW